MAFSDVVRREFRASDEARDKGLTTGDGVVRYDDISYLDDGNGSDFWHLLDVYRPKSAGDAKLPVIVSVHGGGWVYGDKDVYQYYCMDLCRRGFAVVNFSYRLAPEHKHPAQVEDTVLAFKWVKENAFKYGFDLEHLYAVGDSAGANLLGLYCIVCNDLNYAKELGVDSTGLPLPKAVALNCGVYDVRGVEREMRGFMSELMPNKGTPEELDMLDVVSNINEHFPSVFLMTCYGDFLKSQAPLLEAKLKELNIPCESRLYGSEEHLLRHVFHCDIKMAEAKLCNDETCDFFKKLN